VCQVEISGFYSRQRPPYVSGFKPSILTGGLRLYTSRTFGYFFSFPSFRLLSSPTISDVSNKVLMVQIRGKSDGPWFYPLG
jgi:hypothetical protein